MCQNRPRLHGPRVLRLASDDYRGTCPLCRASGWIGTRRGVSKPANQGSAVIVRRHDGSDRIKVVCGASFSSHGEACGISSPSTLAVEATENRQGPCEETFSSGVPLLRELPCRRHHPLHLISEVLRELLGAALVWTGGRTGGHGQGSMATRRKGMAKPVRHR